VDLSAFVPNLDAARNAVVTYVVQKRAWPASADDVGLDAASLRKPAYSIAIGERGVVTLTTSGGAQTTVEPYIEEGDLKWACSGDAATIAVLAACRDSP